MTLPSINKYNLQKRLLTAITPPILLFAILALIFLTLIIRIQKASREVERSDTIIVQTTQVVTLTVKQEAGIYGFLLTNNSALLEPYKQANEELSTSLDKLDVLVANNPEQLIHFASIERKIQAWQTYAQAALSSHDKNRIISIEEHHNGKDQMDVIQAELAAFIQAEVVLRDQRSSSAADAINVIVAVSLIGTLILGSGLLIMTRRHIQTIANYYNTALVESRNQASELEASSQRFEALFSGAPLGIVIARDDKVLAANHTAVKLFGYNDIDEVLGQSWKHFVSSDAYNTLQKQVAQSLLSNEIQSTDIIGARSDGSFFPLRMHVAQIQLGDGLAQVAYLTDQTVQRQLEYQVLRMQKFESIGRLAGGIAHDFNNLLTVITSAVDLAEESFVANHVPLAEFMLIRQTVDRGSALTRQLLAVASRQPSYPVAIDLNQIIDNLQPLLHLLLGNQIHLQVVKATNIWHVKADPGQIEQVLINLVVNARDAMQNSGLISIETTNITLDDGIMQREMAVKPGAYVCFTVRDTGTGMTPEVQARLFEPFFTTKSPNQGTGLGLATSYGIVTQHGGHISVFSELGGGTIFEVYIPRLL